MSKSRKENKAFSNTEVGTLLESLRNDISVIAEGQVALCSDVEILKADTREIKERLIVVEDTIRISLPDVYRRLNRLENKVFTN